MESSESTQKEQEVCEVCRSGLFDENVFLKLVCKDCSRAVHRFCYAPDQRDKRSFKCDQCRKGVEAKCMVCRTNNGILKDIGEKHWVHVICGLFSRRVKLISYRTLEMKLLAYQGEHDSEKSCVVCHHKSWELFHCWVRDCKNYAHPGCIIGSKFFSGNECYLTYNLLDKHSLMLMLHLQSYENLFFAFNYLKRKKLRPFVCFQHNDDPNFIFCTCGRSKIKKDKEQVKQINCDRCKRWFHLECTGVKDLKDDYQCVGCKENQFFRKAVMLPEVIQKMGEIESSGKLDRRNIKLLDSLIFHLSSDLIQLCTSRKNCEQINRHFMYKAIQKIAREQKEYQKLKNFDPKQKNSCVLEIIFYLVKKEFVSCKYITDKQQRELYEAIYYDKIHLGVSNETYAMVKDFIKARVRYIERNIERGDRGERDREKDRDKEKERDRGERRGEEREKTLSSSSRHIQKQARDFAHKLSTSELIKNPSLTNSGSAIFTHLNQVIIKFTNCLLTQGPFQTDLLSRQTLTFIRTIQRCDLSRKAFITLVSQKHPLLLQILFRSRLQEQQIKTIFSKYRFVVSKTPKQEISQNEIIQIVAWYDEEFQSMNPNKKKQLSALFQKQIGHFKIVPGHEEGQSALNSILKKVAQGVPPRDTCLIRNNLVKKLMYLAAGSQVCIADYTDIYYAIRKKKILKTISSPIREELLPLVEEIKTNMNNPQFNLSLTSSQKADLEKFMSRSHFYMRIVNHHVKVKGITNFSGSFKNEDQVPFEDICVLGGFKNLKETAFQAMMNWEYSTESVEFAFKLLAERPLAGAVLTAKEKDILTTLTKNVLAVLCPTYEKYPGVLYPNLLIKICSLMEDIDEKSYPLYQKMLEDYLNWKKDLQKFNNINESLQKLGDVFDIIDLAERKMAEAQKIRLDLTSEQRKLKIIKVWGQISKKLLTLPQAPKFSLITAPIVKTILDQSQYPNNQIRKNIQKLSQDAIFVSKNLKKYAKNKFTDDELHQQIQKIIRKPWKFEGQKFLAEMKKMNLELYFDICELEDMIEFHEKLPQYFQEWIEQHKSLQECQLMRKNIMESPFRIQDLRNFDIIYRKIYQMKCYEPITCVNLYEYNRMLNFGGEAVPVLIEKAINLNNAYTRIETAKKQILNPKPRDEFLLPLDNRELQMDLKEDQGELRNLQILNQNAKKLKERLKILKEQRADWEKYRDLQAEILRQPIALTDVTLEIVSLKKRLDECVEEAKLAVMGQANVFYSSEYGELIQKYKKCGIRNAQMDHFEMLFKRYSLILQAFEKLTIKNYPDFSRLCEEYYEISKNLNIRKLREEAFNNIAPLYIERPGQPTEIGEALLREGGHVVQKPNSSTTTDVAIKLVKVTKRLFGVLIKGEQPQTPVRDNLDESKAMNYQQSAAGSLKITFRVDNPLSQRMEE